MSDLRYSYSGNRRRWSSSSSFPPRKKKEREDPEAGFSTLKQHNYDHDADALKLSAANVYHSIKKLPKLQKDIERKSEKRKSKYLEIKKEDYNGCLKTVWKGMKSIKEILSDEREDNAGRSRRPGQCHACFEKDRDLMLLQAQNDSLQTEYDRMDRELTNERRQKQDALTRLSALTSSKLRDNNPNLTDLSDANRPTKISEMFSELYDNEWTDAYDELSRTNGEVVTIKDLNGLLTDAYDCCMRLSHPIRLFLDTKSTKFQIDSEFRQKVIGHIKRNATAVISDLKEDLESEILKRYGVHDQNPRLMDYINKSIEICWLMAVQDPPMYLYNVHRTQFDSSKFREYQRRGFYTEYIVWPALALCEYGPLLSKGVAQGSDIPYVTQRNRACYIKPTGEENTGGKGRNQTGYPSPYSSYGTNKGYGTSLDRKISTAV